MAGPRSGRQEPIRRRFERLIGPKGIGRIKQELIAGRIGQELTVRRTGRTVGRKAIKLLLVGRMTILIVEGRIVCSGTVVVNILRRPVFGLGKAGRWSKVIMGVLVAVVIRLISVQTF